MKTEERILNAIDTWLKVEGVPSEEARAAAATVEFRRVHTGDVIYEEGEPCEGLWMLFKGRVRLGHSTSDGRELVTAFRGRDSFLEVASALDGGRYSATATAADPCIAGLLPRKALLRIFRYRGINATMVETLCQSMRQQDIRMAITATKTAPGRVYCALLHLSRHFGIPHGNSVTIQYRLTRQDIADLTGLRIETVIRIMTELERSKVLQTKGQVIQILDRQKLKHLNSCAECQFDCSVFEQRASVPAIRQRLGLPLVAPPDPQ